MLQKINYVITTNKNIRCYGCAQNCEKFQAENYVDEETFRANIKTLCNIFSNDFELHFSGGEPLLHKQLESLCEIVYKENPNINICIHTNGILMNTIKDDQLLRLTKHNVKFSFYLYPIISYLKNYEKIVQRFERLEVNMYWTHEPIYFNKHTLKRYGNNCSDSILSQGQLLIVNNKLYPLCPSVQFAQHKIINDDTPYIDMNHLTNINQISKLFLQNNCVACKRTHMPIAELYTNNYKTYELLMDYVYDLGAFLQVPFFYKNIQDSTSKQEFNTIINRYLEGWMDIYIPFSSESLNDIEILDLKNLLLAQDNIEKFNLYFISIDEDINTQQKWFEVFETSNLNTYFFKNKSLYLGEKTFFDNSRISNHYILDVTDLDLLKDSMFLTNRKKEQDELRCNYNNNELV